MKLMICFDGSSEANYALRVAKNRAKQMGAKIFLVTSMVGGKDASKEGYDNAEKLLQKKKSEASEEKIPCETLLSRSEEHTSELQSR